MELNKKIKLNTKQKIIGTAILLAISFGVCTFYNNYKKNEAYQKKMESKFQLYVIPGKEKVFLAGKIEPSQYENIYANLEQGEVHKINVEDQQYVEKGSKLLTYKDSNKLREIKDLNIAIEEKKKEKQSVEDEESKNVIDKEIKQLNKQISDLNKVTYQFVYAPISGKVYLNKNFNTSDNTKPIMKIQSSDFYVKAQVNERDSYKIEKNQLVEITTLATKEKYNGKIKYISDTPLEEDEKNQNIGMESGMSQYSVDINLESQNNLKSGLHVQILALYGSNEKKIPNSAILEENGKYYIYKVKNKVAKKIGIKPIREQDGYTLVSDGVKERDEIIQDIQGRTIKDNQTIYTGEDM